MALSPAQITDGPGRSLHVIGRGLGSLRSETPISTYGLGPGLQDMAQGTQG